MYTWKDVYADKLAKYAMQESHISEMKQFTTQTYVLYI
jgi:hypothetical protein